MLSNDISIFVGKNGLNVRRLQFAKESRESTAGSLQWGVFSKDSRKEP